jgi:hypothetical protein
VGAGAGIRGQVGFGPPQAAVNGAAWSWFEAAYRGDGDGPSPGDHARDVYGTVLTATLPGTFAVAFRFSIDDGQSWAYCDLDGLQNGFDLSGQTGRLEVSPLSVGYCELTGPTSVAARQGEATGPLVGRVYVAGRTPGAGAGVGVKAHVGYGPSGAAPGSASWAWTTAAYQGDVDGPVSGDLAYDEYAATLVAGQPGTYLTAFRFSVDGGLTWTYCDRDGSTNGFEGAEAGVLVVSP